MWRKVSIIVVFIMIIMSFAALGAERVVCDVEVLSDNSARINLSWLEGTNKNPIRIIGWSVVNSILQVTYETSSTTVTGFNSRKIEGKDLKFPMKVVLVEKGKTTTSFTDMPQSDTEKLSILNLYDRGIISGYSDGSFKPYNNVNRAEFAKMITKTAKFSLIENSKLNFKDIDSNFWAKPYVLTLAEKDIFKGRDGGIFDPSGNITIGEVLAVINRTFTFYSKGNDYAYSLNTHWSNKDFNAMVIAGVVKPSDSFYYPYTPDRKATRVECAVLLSRVLEQLHQRK